MILRMIGADAGDAFASAPPRASSTMAINLAVGLTGIVRDGAAAVSLGSELVAVCPQERFSRFRAAPVSSTLHSDAMRAALEIAGRTADDVLAAGTTEKGFAFPARVSEVRVGHHEAHAATSFHTSPFEQALVFISDTRTPESSAWTGDHGRIAPLDWAWRGPGFATIYRECVTAAGLDPRTQTHEFEALARLAPDASARLDCLRYADGGFEGLDAFRRFLADRAPDPATPLPGRASFASLLQRTLGALLLEVLAELHEATGWSTLCVGGGLFYNTFFNTLVRQSGIFERMFVPANPGNAGLAAGVALLAGRPIDSVLGRPQVSPFLGPAYDPADVKQVLDNCKLSYAYAVGADMQTATVDALERGLLVGWFQGRMEWGHRALGHRSILASPLCPFVLDNLNTFLKHRPPYRTYGLVVCEDDASVLLHDPAAAPLMEYEFSVRDPERMRHVIRGTAGRLRVQTVDRSERLLWDLLKRFGEATGTPALVNTSFNGLHEPIVCSPRDAVRVFYGTGLDLLVIDRFLLRK